MSRADLPTLPSEESWPTSIPFEQMVEEWLKAGALKWEPAWYLRAERTATKFARWVGPRSITPKLLGEWEEHLEALGEQDCKSLRLASQVYRNAIRHGWAARNPFREHRRKPIEHSRKRIRELITHTYWERIAQISAAAGCKWYPVWVGCYETGMDRLDVTTLRWDHIDRSTWTIKRIRHKQEKHGHGGAFMTAVDPAGRFYKSIMWSAEILKRRGENADDIDRTYVFPKLYRSFISRGGQTGAKLSEFFKTHNLPAFTFHDLRFARITAMVNSGVPYHVIRSISGHTNDAMLMKYVGNSADLIQASVLQSNRFSKLCPTQAKLPSSSDPTASQISSALTSAPAAKSSRTPRSSSVTTHQKKVSAFEMWQAKRKQRMSEVVAAVPIAPVTGKLSSQEQFGEEPPDAPSSSSSPSDSSHSKDWQG